MTVIDHIKLICPICAPLLLTQKFFQTMPQIRQSSFWEYSETSAECCSESCCRPQWQGRMFVAQYCHIRIRKKMAFFHLKATDIISGWNSSPLLVRLA